MSAIAADQHRVNEQQLRLPFECLRSIQGGINEVRLWHDPYLGCDRVGKRMDVSGIEHDGALPEPATLQRIEHRNVVPVLAAAEVSGYPSPMKVIELITPYYPRGSITDALLGGGERFTPVQAVAITQAALRGLAELHEVHQIAHRDVKSGNILLASDAVTVAVVADLGLAGEFDENGQVIAVNNPTLYSPPELKTEAVLTRASDLYPFYLILTELLGGPLPYAEYTTTDIVRRLLDGKSPVLPKDRKFPIWTPRDLRRIINKIGRMNPSERFQSARELDESLARAVVVNWRQLDEDQWETPFVYKPDRHMSIRARQMKSGQVRLSTLVSRGRGWRRCVEDVDVPDIVGRQAQQVFDQASHRASVR